MLEEDPEKFYMQNITEKMLKTRKKSFGIHEPPSVANVSEDPVEEFDMEDADTSDGNKTYTADNSNSNSDSNKTYTVEKETNGDIGVDTEEEFHYDFPAGVQDNFSFPAEPVSRSHLEDHQDDGNPTYFELPEYLEGLAPAKKIQYNPGKGLCLAYSIAQQGNLDPKKLKKYANKKMVEWWVHIKEFVVFPLSITVGTGNQSYQKPIDHQYELFSFLRSDESLYAYNTGDAEIVILATIINQPIHLLIYNLQGLPRETPLLERCRIHTIYPREFLTHTNKFVLKEDVFLLYEDNVHFSLLVDKMEGVNIEQVLPPNTDHREFVDDLYTSLFPGENVVSTSEDEFVEVEVFNETQPLPMKKKLVVQVKSPIVKLCSILVKQVLSIKQFQTRIKERHLNIMLCRGFIRSRIFLLILKLELPH